MTDTSINFHSIGVASQSLSRTGFGTLYLSLINATSAPGAKNIFYLMPVVR